MTQKFSDSSFGFRPNRNQQSSHKEIYSNITEQGYKVVVDCDLNKLL
ncbi:hypothetical protein [Ureibacillus acetophenoni]